MAAATRPSNTALRLSRHWHEWFGVGTALLLALTALTGLYLNHKDLFGGGDVASRAKPAKAEAPLTARIAGALLDPSEALRAAQGLWGEVRLEHVQLKQDGPGLAWRIKGVDGREVHVDATTGRTLHQRGPRANHTFNKVVHDLHTGEIASLPGKLLVDAGALGMLILTGTGLYLWWKPRRIRAARHAGKTQTMG